MILNVKDASAFLGISPNSLRALAKTGRIPAARIGRAWRFVKDDLEQHIRSQYVSDPTTETEVADEVEQA